MKLFFFRVAGILPLDAESAGGEIEREGYLIGLYEEPAGTAGGIVGGRIISPDPWLELQ